MSDRQRSFEALRAMIERECALIEIDPDGHRPYMSDQEWGDLCELRAWLEFMLP